MKNLIYRLFFQTRLASLAAQIEAIQGERAQLDALERYLIVQANIARVKLLNLDIRARRHA